MQFWIGLVADSFSYQPERQPEEKSGYFKKDFARKAGGLYGNSNRPLLDMFLHRMYLLPVGLKLNGE